MLVSAHTHARVSDPLAMLGLIKMRAASCVSCRVYDVQ